MSRVALLPSTVPPPNDSDAAVETAKKGPVRITVGRRDEKAVGRGARRSRSSCESRH